MSNRIDIIRRQIPIGSFAKVILTDGGEVSGILQEAESSHITIFQPTGEAITLFEEDLRRWTFSTQQAKTEIIPVPDKETVQEEVSPADKTETLPPSSHENLYAHRKAIEIDTFFETKIQSAQLEILKPDLQDPIEELRKNTHLHSFYGPWDRLYQRIKYAEQNDPPRLPAIILELMELVEKLPGILSLRRILSYYQYTIGKKKEAAESAEKLAITSQLINDWYNLAAITQGDDEIKASFALEKFFAGSPLNKENPDWFVYIRVLNRDHSYYRLQKLYHSISNQLSEEEELFFWETCLYVLQKSGHQQHTLKMIDTWLQGSAITPLIRTALQFWREPAILPYQNPIPSSLPAKSSPQPTPPGSAGLKKNSYKQAIQILESGNEREKAIPLLLEAIKQNDNMVSAIKRLVSLYQGLKKQEEIISLLNEHKAILDKRFYDNMLTEAYWQSAAYEMVITILKQRLQGLSSSESSKRVYLNWWIGSCYMHLDSFQESAKYFKKTLSIDSNYSQARIDLALSLMRQENYKEAEDVAEKLSLEQKNDVIQLIRKAQASGQSTETNEMTRVMSSDASQLSAMTIFFLAHCSYKGIPPNRSQEGNFDPEDIEKLEHLANVASPNAAQERAEFYLTSAKLLIDNPGWADPGQPYNFLCRSFTSFGDAAVQNQLSLDTAREWYSEALRVYGGDRQRGSKAGARYALVRYIYASTKERTSIPMSTDVPGTNQALMDLLATHSDLKESFDALAYLMVRSTYAAGILIDRLYEQEDLRAKALTYLNQTPIDISITKMDFLSLWEQRRIQWGDKDQALWARFDTITKVDFIQLSSIENGIKQLRELEHELYFSLDSKRVKHFVNIFEHLRQLCLATDFEARENHCLQIEFFSQSLLEDIKSSPTLFTVDVLYSFIKTMHQWVKARKQEIVLSSEPQITFKIPEGMDVCIPIQQRIELQIAIANDAGSSPVDGLELLLQESSFYEAHPVPYQQTLRGGTLIHLPLSLQLTEKAIPEEVLSLSLCLRYNTLSAKNIQTPIKHFSIQIKLLEDFSDIPNPYEAGQRVEKEEMFYGRGEIINQIVTAISTSPSKSVVIYGQFRTGKSTVLYHLDKRLSEPLDKKLSEPRKFLVLNMGSMGQYLERDLDGTLFSVILANILLKLQESIEQQVAAFRLPCPPLTLPDPDQFLSTPFPLQNFIRLFKKLHAYFAATPAWAGTRIILIIDEFAYIHSFIEKGYIQRTFMQIWKALLQENLFSAVLAGPDVMPKFINKFANEFGSTQNFHITYLTREHAIDLIQRPILIPDKAEKDASRYRGDAVEAILRLTACSPYYIQMLCNELVNYMNIKKRSLITEADVEEVKQRLLPHLDGKFDNLINSGDEFADAIPQEHLQGVLKTIAMHSEGRGCHKNDIKCDDDVDLEAVLKDLCVRKILDKNQDGSYYKIKVELFREWLLNW